MLIYHKKIHEPKKVVKNTTANMRVKAASLADFINSPEMRKAMGIPAFVQPWSACTDAIDYHIMSEASQWIYPVLKGAGIRMMHYSGDRDGAVPTYGTKGWVKSLNWHIEMAWAPWTTDDQVSGYI